MIYDKMRSYASTGTGALAAYDEEQLVTWIVATLRNAQPPGWPPLTPDLVRAGSEGLVVGLQECWTRAAEARAREEEWRVVATQVLASARQ